MDKALLAEDTVDIEFNLQQFMPPPKRSHRDSKSSRSSHISVEFTNEADLLREADALAEMEENSRSELRKSKDSFHLPRKQKETISMVIPHRHASASMYSSNSGVNQVNRSHGGLSPYLSNIAQAKVAVHYGKSLLQQSETAQRKQEQRRRTASISFKSSSVDQGRSASASLLRKDLA